MKVYLIVDITITDLEAFLQYAEKIPKYINKHGGKYIVKGVEPTAVEGDWCPDRVVVLEFPSKKNAEAFLQDPESKSLFKIRHASTVSKMIFAEGCE